MKYQALNAISFLGTCATALTVLTAFDQLVAIVLFQISHGLLSCSGDDMPLYSLMND